ncbi:MAG: hypothetical protein IKC05_00745 [Lentisphaeria bacterium]|nr:hypothetical protein [Lentisphaeria bacterium]
MCVLCSLACLIDSIDPASGSQKSAQNGNIAFAGLCCDFIADGAFPESIFPAAAAVLSDHFRRYPAVQRVQKEEKTEARILFGSLCAVVLLSAFVLKQECAKEFLSGYCGGRSGDDFFYGFYMRKEHVPQQTALSLEKIYGRRSELPPIYFSFLADPWPSMYYILANGQRSKFLFDGPRGKVVTLAADSLVVIHKKENPETVASRFGVTLLPLFQTPMHSVFKVQ